MYFQKFHFYEEAGFLHLLCNSILTFLKVTYQEDWKKGRGDIGRQEGLALSRSLVSHLFGTSLSCHSLLLLPATKPASCFLK